MKIRIELDIDDDKLVPWYRVFSNPEYAKALSDILEEKNNEDES